MQVRIASPQDAAAIARVHVDSWRSTYQGIIPETYLAQLSYEEREARWTDTLVANSDTFVYVLENSDQIVIGFACGGSERTGHPTLTGELYAIYILKAYQQQGGGKMLFQATIKHLQTKGHNSLLIWVVESNPACQFYESMGGSIMAQKQTPIGGVVLNERGYGWLNTSSS